jgi:hypothetical protein
LVSLLPIGIILAQFRHQFGSKVLPIGLTVAHWSLLPIGLTHCILIGPIYWSQVRPTQKYDHTEAFDY